MNKITDFCMDVLIFRYRDSIHTSYKFGVVFEKGDNSIETFVT